MNNLNEVNNKNNMNNKNIKNNIIYMDNDPIKPIIYIGVIFFTYINNKTYFLLLENKFSIYSDIGCEIDFNIDTLDFNKDDLDFNNDNLDFNNNNLDFNIIINNTIIKALQLHTNFLINFNFNEFNLLKSNSNYIYIPSELSLIYFIKAPDNIKNLNYNDFGSYTVISHDEKIKRNIKWIEYTYINNFIFKFNKFVKKMNTIEIKNYFKEILNDIKNKNLLYNLHKKIMISNN